ncbi:hypothetical protein HZH68_000159 [Vespula germanica]|uniref:Uncharacterized protein n=1 Tax=Vespula germanica TaxID=30212 RepID=A0A834NT36_VESGE|nr:hypothetical protein HZH68_000159 [Vespula germanica]
MEQMEEQVYRFEVITSRYEAKASTSSSGNAKISIILEEDTMWDEDGSGNTRTVAAYEISMESMGYTSNRQMREPTVPGAFVKVRDTRQEIREDARATRWSLSGFQFGIFTKVIKDGELCSSREETRERR